MKSFCFWTFNWNILIRIVETRIWTIPEIKVLTDEKEDPPNTFPEYIQFLTVWSKFDSFISKYFSSLQYKSKFKNSFTTINRN